MRLIDIDPIIKDKETLSNAFEIVMDSMTGKCLIECTVPTVQAVPIDVLDKIRAEIESNMESIIGKYDSSIPKFNMPSYKIERNKTREECISIIDKYREVSE